MPTRAARLTAGFEPLLARLAGGATQYFGDARTSLEPVGRLERPFSDLLRVRVTADGRESHAFVKVFRPRGSDPQEIAQLRRWVEREYRATARLHEALRGRPGLTALRPVAVFPDSLAIVTEEAAGLPLDRVLRRALWGASSATPLEAIAGRIGAWIRTYQGVTESTGVLSLEERRDYLDVRLHRLVPLLLDDRERARALALFDDLAARVSPAVLPLVAIHADLCPSNILVAPDGGVTVLDFAMAKTGSRLHDVAHLYMHLEFLGWRPRPRASRVPSVQRALVAGFDPAVTPADPLFRLMLLQHVVCHAVQRVEAAGGRLSAARRWVLRRRWRRGMGVV
ncbi:MAG TPA: aminoglycoside phosphotransferase family protein [Vicinamibacterales bacterium]|nr:aminoglycoside phosphotransferase family protein [Vicinamibacterales bacterium]